MQSHILPLLLIQDGDLHKCIPGCSALVELDRSNADLSENGTRLARESGSNRVCLTIPDQGVVRNTYLLGEVLHLGGGSARVKILSRLVSLSPAEMNMQRECLVGRFETLEDMIPSSRERVIDILMRLKEALERRFLVMGDAGRMQMVNALSERSAFMERVERLYMISYERSEIREVLSNYSAFEKLSFLLMALVELSPEASNILLASRDTANRFEAILAAVESRPRFNRSNQELLRFNSKISALGLIVALILLLVLKGMGFLDTRPAYRNR